MIINRPQQLIVASKTEAKQPGQSQNQDAIHTFIAKDSEIRCGLFIVADGVGGHKDGSLASQTAVATIQETIEPVLPYVPKDRNQAAQYLQSHLYQAIASANEKIFVHAKERNIRMASTVTCALIYNSLVVIGNIGDSRTYLFRDQQLNKITTDHSVVDWLVRQGHLTPEEAVNHPYKNVIMHALGSHEHPETDIFLQDIQVADILLLCSDGIWDTLSDDKLERLLQETDSLETAVSQLTKAAQDHTDDLSLIIAKVAA